MTGEPTFPYKLGPKNYPKKYEMFDTVFDVELYDKYVTINYMVSKRKYKLILQSKIGNRRVIINDLTYEQAMEFQNAVQMNLI